MTCRHCGSEFRPYRAWQTYCSSRCRSTAWDSNHPRRRHRRPRAAPAVRAMASALLRLRPDVLDAPADAGPRRVRR